MIDKEAVSELTWTSQALEGALKTLFVAEQRVHECRVQLAKAIDKATLRPDPEPTQTQAASRINARPPELTSA